VDFLSGLNPQQREAVETTEGPVLILAGAGSGKTRVITHRMAHIIATRHVPPSTLLAVTFTNKAAGEMRARIAALLEGMALTENPVLATFHSFCVRLLRRDGDPLANIRPGFKRNFTIYDDEEQNAIVKAAYQKLGLDEKQMPYRQTLSQISHAKSHKTSPDEMYNKASNPQITRVAAVYEEYEKALRQANALDFDDLLLESVRLLQHDAETRALWQRRINYLMVDEYQDTNRTQYELMRLLSGAHDNICVVGDEDQSIYSWRGADIRNILDFEQDFPRAITIRLEQNYRSTKNILEAASAVIANNTERKGKWLWTESDEGDQVTVYIADDDNNEALFIADTIEKMLRQHREWKVAVLYRTNSQSRQIEEALRRYGRKYNVVGGFSFYQRAEVKDILAYLKLAQSQNASLSLERIINNPARGIGKTTVDDIRRFASENGLTHWDALVRMLDENVFGTRAASAILAFHRMVEELAEAVRTRPFHEALAFIEERSGYRQMLEKENTPESQARLENLDELMNAAAEAVERGEDLTAFLDHAALVADADSVDESAQVTLLTIHNAKGLEFPVVFMAGMEEGLFPHSRSIGNDAAMEEERRLCYVGMTRAEKRLVITWAKWRRRFGAGDRMKSIRSRFLREVPSELVVTMGVEDDDIPEVDLTGERHTVRQDSRKNLYTGKTYNSLENVSQFFKERGMNVPIKVPLTPSTTPPSAVTQPARPMTPARLIPPAPASLIPPAKPKTSLPPAPVAPKRHGQTGTVVEHPKYGRGTIVRREGDGDNAKVVVIFDRYGMKKLVEKFAGFR
jgi:DNA helicase-2/ATP-dependent DNA helicase PcrA